MCIVRSQRRGRARRNADFTIELYDRNDEQPARQIVSVWHRDRMRSQVAKLAVGFAYLAFLFWVGWLGADDDRGTGWSTVVVVLFWVGWLGGSLLAGATFGGGAALWMPAVAFVAVGLYGSIWPDSVHNEVWVLDLAFKAVVSAAFIGLGSWLAQRRTI